MPQHDLRAIDGECGNHHHPTTASSLVDGCGDEIAGIGVVVNAIALRGLCDEDIGATRRHRGDK